MHARRATIEDLPQLTPLWVLERLPVDDLERRFTEFQVVVDGDSQVLGTVGLQISANHGLLHGEAIAKPELADQVRELLWNRIQMVARNHSLDRIWSHMNTPFWRKTGFRAATEDELEAMPESLGEKRNMFLLPLREGEGSAEAIEKQFAMLRALHEEESQQLQRRVSAVKKLALVLTVVVAFLVIAFAVVALKYGPKFLQR
jgi:N-acetylglutamate synthase-like GNAT family acetyltransferase